MVSVSELYSSLKEIVEDDDHVELFEDKLTKLDFEKEYDNNFEYQNDKIKKDYLQVNPNFDWSLLDRFQSVPAMDSAIFDTSNSNNNNNNNRTSTKSYDYKQFIDLPEFQNKTNFVFHRNGIDGHIESFEEKTSLKDLMEANSANSFVDKITGTLNQLPFQPGLNESTRDVSVLNSAAAAAAPQQQLHRDSLGLFDVPPGMKRGIQPLIPAETNDPSLDNDLNKLTELDNGEEVEDELVAYDANTSGARHGNILQQLGSADTQGNSSAQESKENNVEIDNLLPETIDFARYVPKVKDNEGEKVWAHVVDIHHRTLSNFSQLVPNPARTWPFELDTFQKEAIIHLEQGDSVFIAAHTSAGKTVVAEYAIAMTKRNMTKTIYTSPIKALSNQKFRDFKQDFEDVEIGLITGDVQINPEANCLIMTTEILRSMLYKGADLIRDVEFVIFDEVHYVNDQDRGVVWEEVIIMLPAHVKFILLSATVPNTFEFANWIGRTKQKNIYVISTPKRPVPLVINLWAKNTLIPVINQDRKFLPENFKKHKDLLSGAPEKSAKQTSNKLVKGKNGFNNSNNSNNNRITGAKTTGQKSFSRFSGPSKTTWPNLINYLKGKDLLPAVIFVFSKKRCEDYADWLDGLNFCGNRESSKIHMIIERSISRLKKEDRELPQIVKMKQLLERGIAVHHGGLLPIVKELVEILFAEGFVKVLFATETFAMGLNLPTRTVVFSEVRKHDGNSQRFLNPGEFTQMAGRAGRRGLDTFGTVIVMTYTDPLEPVTFKEVTLGVPTKLKSQFRLTYNMILNLLRIEALRVEEMIKYSFSEDNTQSILPENEKQIKLLKEKSDSIEYGSCSLCTKNSLDDIMKLVAEYKQAKLLYMESLSQLKRLNQFLKIGKVVVYREETQSSIIYKLGCVFKYHKITSGAKTTLAVLNLSQELSLSSEDEGKIYLPFLPNRPAYLKNVFKKFTVADSFTIEDIALTDIELVTKYSCDISVGKLFQKDENEYKKLRIIANTLVESFSTITEERIISSLTVNCHQYRDQLSQIKHRLSAYDCMVSCPNFVSHFYPKYSQYEIENEISRLTHLTSDENLKLLPDYEQRLKVLKEAEFIDEHYNVVLKGRVACEINGGFELVITELILDNFLADFSPEEIVALFSVFVYDGTNRNDLPEMKPSTPRLLVGKTKIEAIYGKMLKIFEKYQVPLTIEEEQFLERQRFALLNVVYEWARGLTFKEIMNISPESEGTIVRVINRLDEICRQLKSASLIIGNSELHAKMSEAQELIKRDIVFAASLYL
ncbi:hypothetical protein ACO0QE_001887 [Hanseniaspora vineae]